MLDLSPVSAERRRGAALAPAGHRRTPDRRGQPQQPRLSAAGPGPPGRSRRGPRRQRQRPREQWL